MSHRRRGDPPGAPPRRPTYRVASRKCLPWTTASKSNGDAALGFMVTARSVLSGLPAPPPPSTTGLLTAQLNVLGLIVAPARSGMTRVIRGWVAGLAGAALRPNASLPARNTWSAVSGPTAA